MRKLLLKRILPAVLFFIIVVEVGSKLILNHVLPGYKYNSEPNQVISGYYVYKNRPGHVFPFTYLSSPDDKNVTFDEFGFIKNFDTYEKDTNTYRIFLCGGSAMIGAGQTDGLGYEKIYDYPKSIYSFESSITAFLQEKLQRRFPAKKIQVINTAAYMRLLHHSHILYMETITHLQPDLLITMDGYNDLGCIQSGNNPYYYIEERMLPQYMGLYYNIQQRSWSNFLNLVNYSQKKMEIEHYGNKDSIIHQLRAENTEKKGYFFKKELLHFCSTVRADSVDFLFVYQPILSYVSNKQLTARELSLKKINDESYRKDNMPPAATINAMFDKMGNDIVRKNGHYMNANTQVCDPAKNIEIFTDYCHFTAAGNERMADLIFEKIMAEELIR